MAAHMKRYAGRGVDVSRRGGLARGAAAGVGAPVACIAGTDFAADLIAISEVSQANKGRKKNIRKGSVFMLGGRVVRVGSMV